MAASGRTGITGRHVLLTMLGLFGVVIGVNALFVYLALDSFTGVTTARPYQEGLAYNEVLAARAAQRDLGWNGAVTVAGGASGGERISVTLRDSAGRAIAGLQLRGSLKRPVRDGIDQPLFWREAMPGTYEAAAVLPERGIWDLVVTADDGSGRSFEMKARIWFN